MDASPHYVLDSEEVVFPSRRKREDGDMDMTPMIDITFLLLIFFLVATRMSTDATVRLPPAQHGTAITANDSAVITLLEGPGERARIYLADGPVDGQLLSGDNLAGQEEQIVAYLQEQMNQQRKQRVLIKAEAEVKHREVARVAHAVGQVTEQLYVAVLEVQ
jgi:biopolymer transport protein ExbD